MPAPPPNVTGFACLACGREEPSGAGRFTCPSCGGNLDALYDYVAASAAMDRERIAASRDRSFARWAPLLPLAEESLPLTTPVGGTPLLRAERLGRSLGLENLFLKDDTAEPTASFKDRASVVALLRARETGADTVAVASTGNAASSTAGIAAALGMRAVLFVPESAPEPKLVQMLLYGARVVRVRGSYDDAFDLCGRAAERFGWVDRSTGVNPFTAEGKKTAAFEIALDGGRRAPDWVLVPTGDGNILGATGKGFREMRALDWIDRLPRMVAVQAEGSSAIVRAFREGKKEAEEGPADTIADSIRVGRPRDSVRALHALYDSDGLGVSVTDDRILAAAARLARETGVFAEPSAAAGLAGLERMVEENRVKPQDHVVLVITGHGLKDPRTLSSGIEVPAAIDPTLEAVEEEIG
ncbi:MAG: threonine synthase [Candidatus Eisenbacteria bacterium]|nr:threonine synthase [Candidatus Eisenbacteria bacterium]